MSDFARARIVTFHSLDFSMGRVSVYVDPMVKGWLYDADGQRVFFESDALLEQFLVYADRDRLIAVCED